MAIEDRPTETYVEYYGLVEAPFSLTPNPRFIYQSRSHSAALEEVIRAVDRRECLIVIAGESGTGKTTLCRILLQHLRPRTFLSVVISPFLGADDLLKQVLSDFGVISTRSAAHDRLDQTSSHDLVMTLQRFLGSLIPINAHAVIMIDEAQHLDPRVLEQLRLLSNFETDTVKLLQIILVGQPDLESLLKRPELRQIDQRVSRRCHLEPLTRAEVGRYIERRLWVAHGGPAVLMARQIRGASQPPAAAPSADVEFWRVRFTPAAVRTIALISGGIPRVVNLLCDRALEIGCERRTRTIGAHIVLSAAGRLALPSPFSRLRARIQPLRVAAASVLIAAAITVVWSLSLVKAAPRLHDAAPRSLATAETSTVPVRAEGHEPANVGRLQTTDSFLLAVASFKGRQRATEVVEQIGDLGLPAFTRFDAASGWHVVLVGPYVSRDEALGAGRQLAPLHLADPRILVDHP